MSYTVKPNYSDILSHIGLTLLLCGSGSGVFLKLIESRFDFVVGWHASTGARSDQNTEKLQQTTPVGGCMQACGDFLRQNAILRAFHENESTSNQNSHPRL